MSAHDTLPDLPESSEQAPADWRLRAVCPQTDPDAFFPEKGGSTREAKRICSGCDVRACRRILNPDPLAFSES